MTENDVKCRSSTIHVSKGSDFLLVILRLLFADALERSLAAAIR